MKITKLRTMAAFAAVSVGLVLTVPVMANGPAVPPCSDGTDNAIPFSITVNGETATGRYALPATTATDIVVMAHGYGHTTSSWVEHMKNTAARGAIVVAMDYRGTTVTGTNPDGTQISRGWPAKKGAEDLVAAAQFFLDACGDKTVTAFSVSMGGNMAGLAIASSSIFDYWFDIEGAVNVVETYSGARSLRASGNAFAGNATVDIETEMGGPIEQYPAVYAERAVMTHVSEIASTLDGAVIVHGIEDGLVPYNQSREILAGLRSLGLAVDDYSIARKGPGSEGGTTISSYVNGSLSPFAGHASEKSQTHIVMKQTHIVMKTGLNALWDFLANGTTPACRSALVDGDSGTVSSGPAC
ncbi:MAG: alpha/beta fold hydrolase [Actinomycetota bacterium]